jgi:hypothetical protein
MRGAHLTVDLFREPFVVVIEERDPVAARDTNAGVASLGTAARFRENDESQAWIRDFTEGCDRVGIRAIDHGDHFDGGPGLAQRAVNCTNQQLRPAPRWNDRGD